MALTPFQSNIALSVGSAYIYAAKDSKNILSLPSCLLVDADNASEVVSIGSEARRMEGRTARESMLIWPVSYGAVGDSELCAMLMLEACEKLSGRHHPLEKSRLILTYSDGMTKVERAALVNSAQLAGAKRILAVKAPVAAAVNMGRRIEKAEAQLVVSIGKQVTEVCVISGCNVAVSRHMKTGSRAFDEAIMQQVRRKCSLIIGYDTAETIKKDMGSATEPRNASLQTLSGRSTLTGKPINAQINAQDIYECLTTPINTLVDLICDALFSLPAQFSADILKNGICLTGGGASLYGLAKRLNSETKLAVDVSEEPQFDEVRGALKIAADDRLLKLILNSYSAYEV